MKDFKKLIREAHLGNPLNEEDRATRVDKMLSGEYEDEDYKDSERYADVRADLEREDQSKSSSLIGRMGDRSLREDDLEENEKFEKAARDEYGKPWMELSIAQKQELLSYMNRETEKQFQTDYERRRQGDLDDEYDGMTDYQRGRMDEDMGEWPKELTSRYSDEYRFELEKVMSDRAKYRVIDIESGELKGTPVFGKPESLMAYADDLIKPQGGTQSSHFGTNEGTCGYSEDGDIDPENTDKLKPAGGKGYDWLKNPSVKDQEYLRQKYESWNKMHPNDQIDIEKALKGIFEIDMNEMLMQALPVEKLTDEALLNLLNNLDDDKGKFTNAKSQLMKAAGDEVKRRGLKIHYVDNDRYEFMNEDMNDPVLVKARAAKMADEKEKAKQAALNKKYGSSFMDKLDAEIGLKQELQDLKDERAQLMIDMEQEAEPEGGEIADLYGMKLNRIDLRTAEIRDELEDLRMYESVNEDEIDEELFTPNEMGDEAVEKESDSAAYESLQETLRKKLQDRLK